MNKKKYVNRNYLTTTRIIALGFLITVIVGTILLSLPIASANGTWTDLLTAAFTSTTSVCVTGLVVVDTFSYWSLFGKGVILILIQIGGLGIVSIITLFMLLLRMKITLKSINIGPILASAGIVGLAVGFGAQELVRDFISGFFILLEDQIRTGDVAIINGTTGTVEKIEMRTTTLRDASGVVHIFQNGKINSLSNMTKGWSAIVVDIGVAYKEDTDHVNEIMKQVGDELMKDAAWQSILMGVDLWGVDSFGDSSVILKVKLTTKSGQQWAASREFRRRIKKAFDAQHIEIPFPQVSLNTGSGTGAMPVKIES